MPNEERIDSVINQSPIEKEFEFLRSNLSELTATIKQFPAIKASTENAGSVKELSKAQVQYAESIKAVNSLVQQRFASEAKLVTLQTDYARETAKNRAEQQKLNAELKAQAQAEQAAIGSRERAKAQIKLLTQEKDKLNLVNKEEAKQYEVLVEKIEKYEAFLKKTGTTAEKQRANVGNYQGSAKIIVDALEKEKKKLEELESTRIRVQNAGASPLSPAATGYPNIGRTSITGFAAGNKDLATINKEIENSRKIIEGFSRVTENPRFLNIAAKVGDANAELKGMTKSLIELERAGLGETQGANELRQSLARLTDEVAGTRREIKALSSDTRQFDLFAGSVSFAADVFQTFAGAAQLAGASEEDTAEAIKTLVAVQAVSNGVKGIANELTTKGTAANVAYAATQRLVTTALDTSAAASVRLAAASKLLLGAAIIGAIALLVIKLREYKQAQDEAAASQRDLTEVRKKGLENAAEEISKLKTLYEVSQNQSLSLKDRKKAVDALQSQYPSYFKNLSDEAILAGKAADQYQLLSQKILQTGIAQAAKDKIKEISSAMLDSLIKVEEANKRIQEVIKSGVAVQDKINAKTLASGNAVNVAPIRISTDEKDKEKAISAIKTLYSESYNAVEQGNARIQALVNAVGAGNLVDAILGNQDDGKNKKEKIKKELDAEFEIQKNHLQRRVQQLAEEAANENNSYDQRLQYLTDWVDASEDLITLLSNKQKEGASQNEIKVIEDKALTDREDIYRAFYNRLAQLGKNSTAQQKKEFEVLAGGVYEATKKIAAELAELEEKNRTDQEKKDKEADEAMKERKKELYKQLYSEIQETIFSFIDASFQREEDALARKQTLLDRESEARKNAINASGLSEVERTRQLAAVEKQAAFEREKIEERRRQIAIQRAKFDKAQSIASIIQNTAEAVMAALTSKPPNVFLATLTGVIGAAQLARAIATPIPQYRKGTDNAKPGLSIVGEEGTEMIIDRTGNISLTPSQPTLMNLAGGEKIKTHDITKDILNAVGMTHLLGLKNFSDVPMSEARVNQHLQKKMLDSLQNIEKKSGIIINNQLGIESSAYYLNNLKN